MSTLSAKYKDITIDYSEPTRPWQVKGNKNSLVHACKNILQNSIEAIEDKQLTNTDFSGRISINVQSLDDLIVIKINDNGRGISDKIANKIFNPLFTSKNNSKHPGLGLTVAFQILQDHGGSLEISSQPNVGTEAKISFKRLDL